MTERSTPAAPRPRGGARSTVHHPSGQADRTAQPTPPAVPTPFTGPDQQ
ncbi:hypothetical protein [Sphaerimonospora mesophila]